MERFVAAFRGGDNGEKPWEWCVIDQDEGWAGLAIHFDLTEDEAKALATALNYPEEEIK
jgi:hypothetical protein